MKKIPTFILGVVVGGALFSGVTVGAASVYYKATVANVKVVIDGNEAKLSDSPLNINNRLYLPIRDTASSMNYEVSSVTNERVELKSMGNTINSTNTPETGGRIPKADPIINEPIQPDTPPADTSPKTVKEYIIGDKVAFEKASFKVVSVTETPFNDTKKEVVVKIECEIEELPSTLGWVDDFNFIDGFKIDNALNSDTSFTNSQNTKVELKTLKSSEFKIYVDSDSKLTSLIIANPIDKYGINYKNQEKAIINL